MYNNNKKIKLDVETDPSLEVPVGKMDMDIGKPNTIFQLPHIIENLGKYATDTLKNLRQVSQNYNQLLSPIYFKNFGPTLTIGGKYSSYRIYTISSNEQPRYITQNDLSSENDIRHIFKKIEIGKIENSNWEIDGFDIDLLLSSLSSSSNITTLEFNQDFDEYSHTMDKLIKVINLFPNVENLSFTYIWSDLDSLDTFLKTYFQNSSATARITINVHANHEKFLSKFGNNDKLKLQLILGCDSISPIYTFKNISTQFGTLANSRFTIKTEFIQTQHDLEILTQCAMRHVKQIDKFDMEIEINLCNPDKLGKIQDWKDPQTVKKCLQKISPLLNRFILYCNIEKSEIEKWDILSGQGFDMVKLTELQVFGYTQTLGILSNCPILEYIGLEIIEDDDGMIKTHIPTEYFEILPNLKDMVFCSNTRFSLYGKRTDEDDIEIKSYLKEMLPKRLNVVFQKS